MTKFIFVTGGVVSSLGKGITAASLGMLLSRRGLRVKLQKFDPYLNVDPGTLNPYQHGEVYVTDDGAETDLDLGHYERFTDIPTSRLSNFTSGSIYNSVITKERRGEYLGQTVQLIPHVTNEIKAGIKSIAKEADVVISEIGGTVGDIESLPFLEALRQFGLEEGKGNVLYVHVTLIVHVKAAGEIKTKPTQHSVGRLREIGIIPDFLVCRALAPLSDEVKKKLSLFCNVEKNCIIDEPDVKTSIYEVPFQFIDQKFDELIVEKFGIQAHPLDLGPWPEILDNIEHASTSTRIAVVGKYSELQDAYKSIYEALDHGGIANQCRVEIKRILSEDIEKEGTDSLLGDVAGILVPGGFGLRGVEGKIEAVRFARERNIPYLGICLGMHCASIDFARNVCGLEGADTTENNTATPHPVIHYMPSQEGIEEMGATMRLGAYPCNLKERSQARQAYAQAQISERHRHRLEFNNDYREAFQSRGVVFSGLSPDGNLVEIMELNEHPWFVAVQYHPEFKSTPTRPHPLFRDFIKAAINIICDRS